MYTYGEIISISYKLISHILSNWKKYAYLDNPRCAVVNLRKILDKYFRDLEIRNGELSAIYEEVMNILKSYGYTIRCLKKSGGKRIEICSYRCKNIEP